MIGTAIKEATPEGIVVAKGETETEEIIAETVVWAAGVRGNPIIEASEFENMRGRVKVELICELQALTMYLSLATVHS